MPTNTDLTDRFVTVRGLRFHVLACGPPSAPVVVFLHGITAHARMTDADLAARWHGLLPQVLGGLLDLTADTQTLGKRAGKDAAMGKATLPAILGAEEARRRAGALLDEALAALAPLGPRAEPLRAVARYVLSRKK